MVRSDQLAELFDRLAPLPPSRQMEAMDAAELRPETRSLLEALLEADARKTGLEPEAEVSLQAKQRSAEGLLGETLGGFELKELMGQGGMGAVYRGRRTKDDVELEAAVKVLSSAIILPAHLERFKREQKILSSLSHPQICRVSDVGATPDGVPFLVMELVEGRTLVEHADHHRLTIPERLRLIRKVCDAVAFAHANLIVHRDLKPANVVVRASDGVPVLLDFGIAKQLADRGAPADDLTQGSLQPLTPDYASPEQILGLRVTIATDIFGLGLLLSELLTGARPFDFRDPETRAALARGDLTPPSLPKLGAGDEKALARARSAPLEELRRCFRGDLQPILTKALYPDPARRYATVADFAGDLDSYLEGRPVRAREGGLAYRAAKMIARNRIRTAIISLALMGLFGLGIALFEQRQAAIEERNRAIAQEKKALRLTHYLEGILRIADPDARTGGEMTVRELLERGVVQLEAIDDEPELRLRLATTIAEVFFQLGAYDRTAELLKSTPLPGAEHPRGTLAAETLRGRALFQLGRLDDAAGAFDNALETVEGSPSARLEAMNWRATTDAAAGDLVSGSNRLRAIVEQQKAPEDAIRPQLALALHHLAIMDGYLGHYERAEQAARRASELSSALHGPRSARRAVVLNVWAKSLRDAGRIDEALRVHRSALDIALSTFGPDHARTATFECEQAETIQAAGQPEQAQEAFSTAIARLTAALGPDHPDPAEFRANFAAQLAASGRCAEAEAEFSRAEAPIETAYGETHWQRGRLDFLRGQALLHCGRSGAARDVLKTAGELLARALRPDHPWVTRARQLVREADLIEADGG